jgi:hypothetical protein
MATCDTCGRRHSSSNRYCSSCRCPRCNGRGECSEKDNLDPAQEFIIGAATLGIGFLGMGGWNAAADAMAPVTSEAAMY